jgi:3-oxoacyl-[acyl-carrier protein] reductase
VVLTYFSHQEAVEETLGKPHEMECTAHALHLDATDSEQVNLVMRQAAELLGGKIDILVNNADHLIGRVGVGEMSDEHWHQVIAKELAQQTSL